MQIPEYFEFFNKTKLCSGKMALENISFDLKSMDSVKPLVVTDNRSVKSGYVKILKKSFYDSGMVIGAIYDRVNDYPSTATVREIAELYRIRGCDSIISLGGNSPAAVAKGLNILVSNRSDNLMDFTDMSRSASLRPFLSVLTSAAAGTETSSEAVIDARSYRSFDLMPDIVEQANKNAYENNCKITFTESMDEAFEGAHIVFPKNWGGFFISQDPVAIRKEQEKYKNWICTQDKMELMDRSGVYMHALPADRGNEVTDSVIDGPRSIVYDEAENRLHTAKAVMTLLMGGRY